VAFVESPVLPAPPAVNLLGDVVFGLGAVVLLTVSALRLRGAEVTADPARHQPVSTGD
jgi:hypothetical protein